MFRSLYYTACLLVVSLSVASAPVGIITPLTIESQPIVDEMTQKKEVVIGRVHYLTGRLHGKDVVLTQSGMGIANISFITSRMIEDYQPKQLYLLGSSGAITSRVKKGMVVLGRKVTNVDFGQLTSHGVSFPFEGLLKYPQNGKLQPLDYKAGISINIQLSPKTVWGNIATSEMLPNSPEQVKLLATSGYDIAEMEGSGFMQVCWFYHKPCLVVRGVSNNTDEPITMEDVHMSAKAATSALTQLLG